MTFNTENILSILDKCCDNYTFPMLDNGYVYLAATRLSLYRSAKDWAIVIEAFGYSPRAGLPDTTIYTFSSQLYNRNKLEGYVNAQAHRLYLENNPYNEFRSIYPIEEGKWQDEENCELIAKNAIEIIVRDNSIPLPPINNYLRYGIELEEFPSVQVFELCRFLAEVAREQILATPQERHMSVRPEMVQLLQLEEWHHPNVVDDNERPSKSETFQQLAKVLVTSDVKFYCPSQAPNTHWKNWPEGGRL
ncbi:MAG: hypothetical protein HY819_06610 [Acidobacteria bacterium]|nr:hypothetical protein [Acidobacteriota bacterium]